MFSAELVSFLLDSKSDTSLGDVSCGIGDDWPKAGEEFGFGYELGLALGN
jgi:hypothetical protein